VNPIDLLLSALVSHGLFVIEKIAQQMHIPLDDLKMTARGDFDPRGVLSEGIDAGLHTLHLQLVMSGTTEAQAEELIKVYKTRCPIYVTLARSVRIDLDVTVRPPAGHGIERSFILPEGAEAKA
jgi:uncharacterized OsmC-like protein